MALRGTRKPMSIEAILRWAYRDELPKGGATYTGVGGATAPGFGAAALGDMIDDWSWEWEPGHPAAMGEPHPDALTVSAHVQALGAVEVDAVASREELLPEAWRLIDPDDLLRSRIIVDRTVYVISHAKMGTRPEWRAGWAVGRIIGRNGQPVVEEVDEHGHYGPGASCPLEVVPEPRDVVTDRAIYAAWHGALVDLANRVGDSLVSIEPLPPEAPARPWIDGDEPPVILPDLSKPALSRGRVRRRRRAAG